MKYAFMLSETKTGKHTSLQTLLRISPMWSMKVEFVKVVRERINRNRERDERKETWRHGRR